MGKHSYEDKDWMYYYNEEEGRVKCLAVGSRYASKINSKIIRGFHGTYLEAREMTEVIDAEYKRKTGKENKR